MSETEAPNRDGPLVLVVGETPPPSCLVSTVLVYNPTLTSVPVLRGKDGVLVVLVGGGKESVILSSKIFTNAPHAHTSEAALRAQSSSWFLVRSSP